MLDGLRRGWEVSRKNIGPVLLIWLITGVIGVVIGLVIALPMLIVVVPTVIGFATSKGDLPTTALLDQWAVLRAVSAGSDRGSWASCQRTFNPSGP